MRIPSREYCDLCGTQVKDRSLRYHELHEMVDNQVILKRYELCQECGDHLERELAKATTRIIRRKLNEDTTTIARSVCQCQGPRTDS